MTLAKKKNSYIGETIEVTIDDFDILEEYLRQQ